MDALTGAPQPPLLPRDAGSASAPGRTGTSAVSPSSSSTSTTSRRPNDRLGHLAATPCSRPSPSGCARPSGESDIACRVGGDEFAVILPEAGARDAEQLYRRIQFAVGSGSSGPAERVRLSAGIAELRPEDDAVSLFERADEALYRAKEGGKGQVPQADGRAPC